MAWIWSSDRPGCLSFTLKAHLDRFPFPLSSTECPAGCSPSEPTDHLILTGEMISRLRMPMGGCFFTHASGRLMGWVTFARNPFHPPEGWRADFCSVERLHQVVHCRARRPAFQDATSGGIVIHKEEHSLVRGFGSEFPSDKYYCEEFNLAYRMVSHKVLSKS